MTREVVTAYLDIKSGDFKELYRLAYRLALKRITQSTTITEDTTLFDITKIFKEKQSTIL